MTSLRKITKGLEKKFLLLTFLTPICMIGEVVLETIIPYLMSHIIDNGIKNHDLTYVLHTGLVMILAALLSLFFGVAGACFSSYASQGFSRSLRLRLFSKIQTFSFSNLDKFSTASLVTRLTTDVTNLQNVYQLMIRIFFRAPFMLIAGTFMSFCLNARLSLIFILAIPFLALIITLISVMAHPRFEKMLKKYDLLNTVVQENLIAVRVVKAFVRREFECEKFNHAAEELRNSQVKAEKLIIFLMPVMQAVVYSCLISVFWFGGHLIAFGNMLPGQLVGFLTYVSQILMSLMMLGMIFVNLVLSQASLSRIVEVLDEEATIKESDSNKIEEVDDGSVDFENVSFSYDGQSDNFVLENISFHIHSGEKVGIIGGTGSSKTTLVSLIARLYDIDKGVIKVGGHNLKDYSIQALRNSISIVLQKNMLFSGSIKENLLWGKEDAKINEIISACDASQASAFVEGFSASYDTMLEPAGANLSGGQKQRLCIARALLKNPKILIMDDSTSSVDTATERKIKEAINIYHPETTKIIIAHRISSIEDADWILVLEDGKIAGMGKHDKLLQECEIYREIYESQKGPCSDL